MTTSQRHPVTHHIAIGATAFFAPVVGIWTALRLTAEPNLELKKAVARLNHPERFGASARTSVLAAALAHGVKTLEAAAKSIGGNDELVHDFQAYVAHRRTLAVQARGARRRRAG